MAVTPTTLRENLTSGMTGALAELASAYKAVNALTAADRRVDLVNQSTGYNYRGSYAAAYAQPSRAAYLTSIGAPGRTDFNITLTGQTVTINPSTGQITAQDPAVPWLLDPQDTSEIGPA